MRTFAERKEGDSCTGQNVTGGRDGDVSQLKASF